MKKIAISIFLAACIAHVGKAGATNGYFTHGYGIKAQGMGGVGIALPQDALAAASNPAGMALVGDRVDLGLSWFRPIRESEISGNAFPGVDGTYEANDRKDFFIPEFGYNRQLGPDVTLGVSVYGNGGMNTSYGDGIPLFNNTGTHTGVDMAQLFLSPTVSWKITPSQAVGVSLNLVYQRFEMKGIQNFIPASTSPANVTNNGHDGSHGAGLRLGWIGQFGSQVTLGATYQTRTWMSKFDDYKGLFAEQGDFDIPSTYGIGIAVRATPQLTMAADIQRINYSEIGSVGRRSLPNLPNGLGADNGPGFAWHDITVVKLGASYAVNERLTVRAGYNHGSQPIRGSDTLLNMLAPGVIKNHLTLGATWTLPNQAEFSFAYMHAFENEVKGHHSIPPGLPPGGMGGGEASLRMYQDALGIAYGWKL